MKDLPASINDEETLNALLTNPSPELIETVKNLKQPAARPGSRGENGPHAGSDGKAGCPKCRYSAGCSRCQPFQQLTGAPVAGSRAACGPSLAT